MLKSIRSLTSKIVRDEKGATAIEYGLIAALVSIAALAAFKLVGSGLTTTFTTVSDAVK